MFSMYRMKPPVQATPAKTTTPAKKAKRPRIQVRSSGVHGKGVFALEPIEPGQVIIEYVGEIIDDDEAERRHPRDPQDPDHTFYFSIAGGKIIDAFYGGNAARWINHACDPNCEADETDEGRVFIKALRPIAPGEELNYSYGLFLEERYTSALKKRYACRCGAAECTGTMLAPKTRKRR